MEGDLKAFSELPEEPERGGLAQGFTRGALQGSGCRGAAGAAAGTRE